MTGPMSPLALPAIDFFTSRSILHSKINKVIMRRSILKSYFQQWQKGFLLQSAMKRKTANTQSKILGAKKIMGYGEYAEIEFQFTNNKRLPFTRKGNRCRQNLQRNERDSRL